MNPHFSVRLAIVTGCLALVALFVVAKLFFVQVIHHTDYANQALGEYTSQVNGIYDRGTIYFKQSDGTLVPAATLNTLYRLVISPMDIPVALRGKVYDALNAVTPLDKTTYDGKFSKANDQYEVLADHLSTDMQASVTALKLKGVRMEEEKERFYPGGHMASQTLGFVGYSGNDLLGEYGLEREYNDVLSRSKSDLYVNFFAELFTSLHKTIFKNPHAEGDIVTSIEPQVQHTFEQTLADINAKWHPDSVGGLIMDPKTGEILAMGGLPDFDPNTFSKVSDIGVYQNPNVENVYELGSIIKSLTMSSGINAGVITPTTTYMDTGCMTLNKEHICNFDKLARGKTDMQTVFDKSLNMGATFIMQQLGRERFRNYFDAFGVNQKTGIDLPGEVQSIVTNLQSTRDVEYATASYGQGIALTPVAAIRAFSALANGGATVTPHVVTSIQYADGSSKKVTVPDPVQVITPETASTVSKMLVKTVDTALLGGTLKLANYTVAAKTGTAQVANPNGGGYYKDRYLHSMFGYYPASNPRFVVLIYTVNPQNAGLLFSAQTSAEPFMKLAKFLLTYYDVAPDRQ